MLKSIKADGGKVLEFKDFAPRTFLNRSKIRVSIEREKPEFESVEQGDLLASVEEFTPPPVSASTRLLLIFARRCILQALKEISSGNSGYRRADLVGYMGELERAVLRCSAVVDKMPEDYQ